MSTLLSEFSKILELNNSKLTYYSLKNLKQNQIQLPKQTLVQLLSTKDLKILQYTYEYISFLDEDLKKSLLEDHINHELKHFPNEIFHLLDSFNWSEKLLNNIIEIIKNQSLQIKASFIQLLSPYRFLIKDFLIQFLKNPNIEIQRAYYKMIALSPSKEDEKILINSIESKDIFLQAYSFAGLWKLGNTSLLLAFTSESIKKIKAALIACKYIEKDQKIIQYMSPYFFHNQLQNYAIEAGEHEAFIDLIIEALSQNKILDTKKAINICLKANPQNSILKLIQIHEMNEQDSFKPLFGHFLQEIENSNIAVSLPLKNRLQELASINLEELTQLRKQKLHKYFTHEKYFNDEFWPNELFNAPKGEF